MEKKDRGCLISVLIACIILVLLVLLLFAYSLGSLANPQKEMTENFRLNEGKFYDLKAFVNSVDPARRAYRIDLYDHDDTGEFSISLNGQFIEKAYSDKSTFQSSDSVLQLTPWNNKRLLELDKRLQALECKSILSSPQFKVGQIINGQDYYYSFFDYPLKKGYIEYNDSCKYVIYNERVVFEYEKHGDFETECFSK